MRFLLPLLLLATLLCTCASRTQRSTASPTVQDPNKNALTSEEVPDAIDLTSYLRRIPGVNISGSGAYAVVTIRGPVSFQAGSNNPLYVVDGQRLGTDYSAVYRTVNGPEIARVRVLKGGDETAIYGVAGAAGVIEITTKQQ